MDIVGLIKNALLAIAMYFELKSKAFYYDLLNKSKTHQQELINEIEKLRTIGTNDSNDRADVLRQQLIKEKQFAEHISAKHFETSSK